MFGLVWTALNLGAFVLFIHVDWAVPDECLSADGLRDNCYCEALRPGVIHQPVNTLSSLVFVLAGLIIVRPGDRDATSSDRARQSLFGALAIYLGVGSMAFHATQSDVGGFIDSSGMYLLPSLFALLQVGRLRRHPMSKTVALWLAGNGVLFGIARVQPVWATEIFTAVVVGLVGVQALVLRQERLSWHVHGPFLGVAVSFGIGTVVWLLSGTGAPLCLPDSIFQGHAVWHLATAISVVLLYTHLRRTGPLGGDVPGRG